MTPNNDLKILPPKIDIETVSVLKQLNKSSRALAELKAYSELIPNKEILISSLALQEAKASSEIENIVTTNDSLYKAIAIDEKKIDPSTKEVLNYRTALWRGVELVKEKGFISTNLIIEIQETLENNSGGIRKIPGTALKNALTDEVIYTPPSGEELIRQLLRNLEEYYNIETDIDPLIKLAISHYQFEAIHPFYDGNGRTGRILNILYLLKEGLLESPILYLSSYIIKNKGLYYKLLEEVTINEAWEKWVLYILKAIEITSRDTLELAKNIKSLMDITTQEVKNKLPKIYNKELIEFIFTETYTKGSHLVEQGFATRKTMTKYLRALEEIGILKSEKVGREVIYINVHLFNLLKGS
ncbi:Fic family protein [Ilyobacter polytropus]|uniref:Filamentation induced by cAMP protein Fic n=1 Tax=Ilyobacter polytropus (strain ATCC 51220 / DSM 2926 / LMG 16218 / CuHBu1) TaxID=572544 RepID=E3H9L9_ILYPC|nr:Fic family protein [Ilyobacter polytropus]ADO83408.1 filamentation induced by cAMP protein Fic [Ilyobacter polytropus DSM 2926]ADO84644.1 filamentation induced by cAMP protein Fic [Ilyobacter polytropus DSM 2926]